MSTRIERYQERARQLLLTPEQTAAYLALNDYADDYGACPSCGANVGGYESERVTHARSCPQLLADGTSSVPSWHKDGGQR